MSTFNPNGGYWKQLSETRCLARSGRGLSPHSTDKAHPLKCDKICLGVQLTFCSDAKGPFLHNPPAMKANAGCQLTPWTEQMALFHQECISSKRPSLSAVNLAGKFNRLTFSLGIVSMRQVFTAMPGAITSQCTDVRTSYFSSGVHHP